MNLKINLNFARKLRTLGQSLKCNKGLKLEKWHLWHNNTILFTGTLFGFSLILYGTEMHPFNTTDEPDKNSNTKTTSKFLISESHVIFKKGGQKLKLLRLLGNLVKYRQYQLTIFLLLILKPRA